jgi:hypothetical protein
MPSNEFICTLSRKIKSYAGVDNQGMKKFLSCVVLFCGLLALTACQPSLNWRASQLEGASLRFELPCKPDRAVRAVNMAGQALDLAVAGCEADDAVWAVMSTQVQSSVNREELFKGWRQATLQNMRAQEISDVTWAPQPTAVLPGTLRVKAQGTGPQGQFVTAHAIWFSYPDGDQIRLVHAVVYFNESKGSQSPKSQQSADQFLESIKWP